MTRKTIQQVGIINITKEKQFLKISLVYIYIIKP